MTTTDTTRDPSGSPEPDTTRVPPGTPDAGIDENTEAGKGLPPEPVDGPEGASADAPEPDEDDDADEGNPSGEAARYRRRLRDTETERDELAGRVAALEERIVGAAIGGKAELFFRVSGTAAGDYFDAETGDLDQGRLDAALDAAYAELYDRPRNGRSFADAPLRPAGSADQGVQGTAYQPPPEPTWSTVLAGPRP